MQRTGQPRAAQFTPVNPADPKYDGPCAQFSDYIKAGFLEILSVREIAIIQS
jgi:hypothetical protein